MNRSAGAPHQLALITQATGCLSRDVSRNCRYRRNDFKLGDTPAVLVRGDDWAEKIAYKLARQLVLPSVVTELASAVRIQDSVTVTGSMSRDMRRMNWRLSSGATLLAERDENFGADTCSGHTVEAISTVLDGISRAGGITL